MPVILAIESTQRTGGVALQHPGGEPAVERLTADRGLDDDLMPAIDRLFRRAGLAPTDLDAVGVSIGPGGFTGLRIAVSTAKILGFVLGALVVPVPTALVVVEGSVEARRLRSTILVALSAKGETFWADHVSRGADETWALDADASRIVDASTCPLDGVGAVLGDRYLPESFAARCDAAGVRIVEPVFDPLACLMVTQRRLAAGATCDPHRLVPFYPRRPEAERLWELRRGAR